MKNRELLERIEALELAVLGKTQAAENWPECDFGKRGKIVGNESNHAFDIGAEVDILHVNEWDSDWASLIDSPNVTVANGVDKYKNICQWKVSRSDYELIEEEPPLPEPDQDEPDKFGQPKEVHEFTMKPPRPEIIPAEPLRGMPKSGTILYVKVDGGVEVLKADQLPKYIIEDGRCFPDTQAGKLGAELRAKQGIVPYPEKSNPAKIESLISEIEKLIFEVQTETEFRSEFDFMNEKLEEIRDEVAKVGPVTPAKALTEAPKDGARYWLAEDDKEVGKWRWDGVDIDRERLSEGRIFPFTLSGKIGAAMFQEGGQDE